MNGINSRPLRKHDLTTPHLVRMWLRLFSLFPIRSTAIFATFFIGLELFLRGLITMRTPTPVVCAKPRPPKISRAKVTRSSLRTANENERQRLLEELEQRERSLGNQLDRIERVPAQEEAPTGFTFKSLVENR